MALAARRSFFQIIASLSNMDSTRVATRETACVSLLQHLFKICRRHEDVLVLAVVVVGDLKRFLAATLATKILTINKK